MSVPDDPRGSPGTSPAPGRIVLSLLNLIIPKDFPYRDELLGDLIEEWESILQDLGPAPAELWLWGQGLGCIAPMSLWRLERVVEELGSDERVVRVIHLLLLVYLLPAILTTLLVLVVAIVLAHVRGAAERALFGEADGPGEDPVESHPAIIDASGRALAAFDLPVEFLFEIVFHVPGLSGGAGPARSYDITPGPGTRWDYAAVSRVGWELRLCGDRPGAGADHLIQYRGTFPWLELTGTHRVILHWRAPIRVVGGATRWKGLAHISVNFYKRP